LTVFVGTAEGGVLAFATYNYENLNGQGNPNVYKFMKYGADLVKWHFVYFGYSRKARRAYGVVSFENRKAEVDFPNTNHFLARSLNLYVAKDKFYPSFNGRISDLRMVLCDGAFDVNYPSDPPPIVTPPPIPPKPDPEPTCIEGSSQIGDAAHNQPALVDIKADSN
jgi:hypothetical protein